MGNCNPNLPQADLSDAGKPKIVHCTGTKINLTGSNRPGHLQGHFGQAF